MELLFSSKSNNTNTNYMKKIFKNIAKVKKHKVVRKAIDGSGRRPLNRQTQDINQKIKDLFDGADDPQKF